MGTTGAGAWVAAAKLVAAEANLSVRMCGWASGGKPIAYWHPGQPGHDGLFPVIEIAGRQADVFLWYQGENNCGGPSHNRRVSKGIDRARPPAFAKPPAIPRCWR